MSPTAATRMGHAHFCPHARQSLCLSYLLRRRHTETLAHPTTTITTTTCELLACYATGNVNAIDDHQPRPHRLHTPVSRSLAPTSTSRRIAPRHGRLQPQANPNTNRDTCLCLYNHRHIAAQHANRLPPTVRCHTLAHVCINLPLQHYQRRRRARCPLEVRAWTSTRRAVRSGTSKRQKSFRHRNIYRTAYRNAEHETHGQSERDNPILALE